MAVVPFENLSSNSELDWLNRALPAVLVSDLAGSPRVFVQAEDSVDTAYGVYASRVLKGYFYVRNGRLDIRATLQDLRHPNSVQSFQVFGSENSAARLVDALARDLNPSAHAFSSSNSALRAYGSALQTRDRPEALRDLELATKDDPRFSLAYLDWARLLAAQGDRAGALKVIEASARVPQDPMGSAEINLFAASLHNDLAARESALADLGRLTPANDQVFHQLAELQLSHRQFQQAARNFEAAARLNPDEEQTWNELGYTYAYAQDLSDARRALEHYRALLPVENGNALDSLGEVSFYLGDFNEAAGYFLKADEKNGSQFSGVELVKAAEALLMQDRLADADALFRKYIHLIGLRNPTGAVLDMTRWNFLTGRRREAMDSLSKALPAFNPDAQSLALSQLSIWKLQTGDRKSAAELANQAAVGAISPAARNLSELCRTMASPPAGTSGSKLADAFALVFARKYTDAAPLLDALYRGMNPEADGQIRILLAWALAKANRLADAEPLLTICPLPLESGDPAFASFIFPRYLFLRGLVFQHQGNSAEAKRAFGLFARYSGDIPDIEIGENSKLEVHVQQP